MAYEQLPIVEVDLDQLLLDLENYRIPTRRDDETGALNYLFASEDVLGAARLILRDGYFDNEVPIVTSASASGDSSPYTVLEGNRRVSALKALQDPTIVPGHEAQIRALLKRYAVEAENLPERIRVIVAPDRAAAAPHVARLHTGVSKKRWSRDQQATFYYSLVDERTTVDDVKAQYPDVEVARFMRMAVTRRFLSAAPFSDHTLRQYAASDDLAMSAFEYAYRSKEIATAIGVEFDKDEAQRIGVPRQRVSCGPPQHSLARVQEEQSGIQVLGGSPQRGSDCCSSATSTGHFSCAANAVTAIPRRAVRCARRPQHWWEWGCSDPSWASCQHRQPGTQPSRHEGHA
jgi:hypothetical protein